MAKGTPVARLSVRVLPDTSEFGPRLKAELAKVRDFKINVDPDLTGFAAKIKAEAAKVRDVKVGVDFDTHSMAASHAELQAEASRNPVQVPVELDRKTFRNSFTRLTTRDGHGLTSSVASWVRLGITNGLGLTGSVVKLSSIGMAGATAAAGVGALLLKVVPLVGEVAQLAGLLPLIPAALGGLAGIVGTVALGLHGMSDAFKNMGDPQKFAESLKELSPAAQSFAKAAKTLKDSFAGIQMDVQEKLFSGLGDELKTWKTDLIPALASGFGNIATGLNSVAKNVIASFGNPKVTSAIRTLFGNTGSALTTAAPGLGSIVTGFSTLSAAASKFFDRFALEFTEAGKKFESWVDKVTTNGQLDKWINQGVDAFKNLAGIVGNLSSVIASVTRAAGGEGLLKGFNTLTGKFADWSKTDVGQRYFNRIFTTADQVLSALAPIIPALGSLGAALNLGGIAKAVGPQVANIIDALKPAASSLGKLLADLATPLGKALTSFATFIGPAIDALTPGLKDLFGSLPKIAPDLGGILVDIGKVGSAIGTFLSDYLPPFVSAVKTIADKIADIVGSLGDFGGAIAAVLAVLAASGFGGKGGKGSKGGRGGRFGGWGTILGGIGAIDLGSKILDEVKDPKLPKDLSEYGKNLGTNVAEGFTSGMMVAGLPGAIGGAILGAAATAAGPMKKFSDTIWKTVTGDKSGDYISGLNSFGGWQITKGGAKGSNANTEDEKKQIKNRLELNKQNNKNLKDLYKQDADAYADIMGEKLKFDSKYNSSSLQGALKLANDIRAAQNDANEKKLRSDKVTFDTWIGLASNASADIGSAWANAARSADMASHDAATSTDAASTQIGGAWTRAAGSATWYAQQSQAQIQLASANSAASVDAGSAQIQGAWTRAAASASGNASGSQGAWQRAAGNSAASWNNFYSQFYSSTPAAGSAASARGALNAWAGIGGRAASLGAEFGNGLAAGINSRLGSVQAAANNLAEVAIRAAQAAAKIASPSKKMMEVGAYMSEGLAIGIASNVGMVRDAAHAASSAAIDSAAANLPGRSAAQNTMPSTLAVYDVNNVLLGTMDVRSGQMVSQYDAHNDLVGSTRRAP